MSCDQGDTIPRKTGKPVVLVVAAALLDADGRILIAQRPEGKQMAGLWEFPGGKMQDGETPEGALVRELQEELGIDVCTGCLHPITFASHHYEKFHLLMPLYVIRQWDGMPDAVEHSDIRWVRVSELGQYNMPPADVPLVQALQDILS